MTQRSAIASLGVLLLAACASTYEPPRSTQSPPATATFNAPRADLLKATRRLLVAEGIQVMSADDASGTITTMPQDFRLTPELADCGTTMGIDYLKDNRTSSKVGYGLMIDDGKVTVRSVLQSEYKPGDVAQNITLSCVSHGVLERRLLQKLQAAIGS
ncbi:hypothetical protein DBR47_14485 [Paucibacter sp. KBW04]|uniref:hypothetical protein n=1 Tax=Paucibacter sp. KBW04 TaxID=2153361 RepID=UPI000F58BFAC|nr:hypothetical protein [Paucibacter sp. KBW04]RQO57996.1 hypothetical protein DBR47_14485 [Paucibacter sp. KBW04]